MRKRKLKENRVKPSFREKLFAATVSLALVLAVSSTNVLGTQLLFNSREQVDNRFALPYNSVAVVEDFPDNTPLAPGDTAVKKVYFTNTGNADAFVRITFRESWTAEDGKVLSTTFDHDNNPNTAQVPVMEKNWTSAFTGENPQTGLRNWQDFGDRYYYYTQILKAGATTEAILESITLHKDAPDSYSRANYVLEFKVEAAVYTGNPSKDRENIKLFWGKIPTVTSESAVDWGDA